MDNQDAPEAHHRQIHDRLMWVCPKQSCRKGFTTEAEPITHMAEHKGPPAAVPRILSPQYGTYDLASYHQERQLADESLQRQ